MYFQVVIEVVVEPSTVLCDWTFYRNTLSARCENIFRAVFIRHLVGRQWTINGCRFLRVTVENVDPNTRLRYGYSDEFEANVSWNWWSVIWNQRTKCSNGFEWAREVIRTFCFRAIIWCARHLGYSVAALFRPIGLAAVTKFGTRCVLGQLFIFFLECQVSIAVLCGTA